jgi:glycosyltransferase involved in cell wall biosynthesis
MVNGSMLVSIAMCTYNGEAYISKQLTSILAQTYTNLEVIVVDDRSSDKTIEIIKSFQINDNRIKLYQNATTFGFNKNFEKAITLCTGNYIAISDQDDLWLEQKIERLMHCIGSYEMVYANSARIDENDNLLPGLILDPNRKITDFIRYENVLLENFVTGHNLLFKKEAANKFLPFPEKGFYDWWMGFVMLYENKLTYCNEILTHYRIHQHSVINVLKSQFQVNRRIERLAVTNTVIQHLQNFKTYSELKETDKVFIEELESALRDKLTNKFSIRLYRLLWLNFKAIFPGYKKPTIKRIFFLYRYCKA